MRDNEKQWVTAVTTAREWGARTTFLYTENRTRCEEKEYGTIILDGDDALMYVAHSNLISIEFDTEDPDGKEG